VVLAFLIIGKLMIISTCRQINRYTDRAATENFIALQEPVHVGFEQIRRRGRFVGYRGLATG